MDSTRPAHGVIARTHDDTKQDYLFRVSVKALIVNDEGHVLLVREYDHDWWDLPGGGVDHGESIEQALSRELFEEVSFEGAFTFKPLLTEDPRYSSDHNVYQMRVIFLVFPDNFNFEAGKDCAEIAFTDPVLFEHSEVLTERRIFEYSQLVKRNATQ